MINFACPGCQATFKLPDEMAGKTARCSKCNNRFTVPGGAPKPAPAPVPPAAPAAAATAPPMPPKKTAPGPKVMEAEILDAEVVEEPAAPSRRPAQRAAAIDEVDVVDDVQVVDEAAIQEPPRRGRRPVVDEDDDDRRPSRRDRDRGDRDRDDDWDDDDGDRPRRRRRREGSGSSKMGVIMASVGGGSFAMMMICFVGMSLSAQPAIVVNRQPIFNPPPGVQFNPAPPNQGQPNPGQPNQPNPGQPNQPNPGQPNPGQPNPGQPNPGQPNPGQPVAGGAALNLVNGAGQIDDQLTMNDGFDNRRPGCRAKRYTVQLQAGKTYIIDMTSPTLDTFLRLEQNNGQQVQQNDDGGVNLNAKMVYRPFQSGTFTIIATTFEPGETGNFRLSVRAQ
jgi:predicted Zn finger-like uncharacterized protein